MVEQLALNSCGLGKKTLEKPLRGRKRALARAQGPGEGLAGASRLKRI